MNNALKPVVQQRLEEGWWVALDQGDSVTLRKFHNRYSDISRPLIQTISMHEGEVVFGKVKVVDQGGSKYKWMALSAIVLFILLLIFVA